MIYNWMFPDHNGFLAKGLVVIGGTRGDEQRTACFSPDMRYRYCLDIDFSPPMVAAAQKVLCVIGLNPSTADHLKNDPTIAKLSKWAKAHGYNGLRMQNVYAYRSTDPAGLKTVEPYGVANSADDVLLRVAAVATEAVCAWGNHAASAESYYASAARSRGVTLRCWGTNQNGTPKHPLYLPLDRTPLEAYGDGWRWGP